MAQNFHSFQLVGNDGLPFEGTSTGFGATSFNGKAIGYEHKNVWRHTETNTSASIRKIIFGTASDAELLLRYRIISANASANYHIALGARLNSGVTTGYLATVKDQTVQLLSPSSSIHSTSSLYSTASVPRYLRFGVSGTAIRFKAWLASATEPTSWTSVTDTTHSSSGDYGILIASSGMFDIDWCAIGTGGDLASSTLPSKTVSGTVYAPSASAGQLSSTKVTDSYPVHMMHQATGCVIASALTSNGQYSLSTPVPAATPVYITAIDTLRDRWVGGIAGKL